VRTDELDFALPDDLIAKHPARRRDAARLLHYRRDGDVIADRVVSDLPELLRAGDVLVFNDAKVTPAKITLVKPTGGRVGGLFLGTNEDGTWQAMLKGPGQIETKEPWRFDPEGPPVRVIEKLGGGVYRLAVEDDRPAELVLAEVGRMPLPPYIGRDEDEPADRERYQTVYATTPGSVAAPTAGLHFTDELLRRLDERGVIRTSLTLHVGVGTFRPVSADDLDDHDMHRERYELPAACCDIVNAAKRDGRRVVAIGTTSARVLEGAAEMTPHVGDTAIFIKPPYAWKRVNALWTNFHLPRSTLIAMVDAFVGSEARRGIYQHAIEERYRFFSYGDATFLE
jgi:S-adenosylmethionine:tRNA ribosyltransferase-isomerase